MKKTIASLMLAFALLSCSSATVFAEDNYVEQDNTINGITREDILSEYLEDEQFRLHLQEDEEGAYQMIDDIFLERNSRSARGGLYGSPACSVPSIAQKNGYYCGPASALQALSGIGVQNSVSGSNNTQKQDTLANRMQTNSSGTDVYRVRDGLNAYISSSKYKYILGSSLSENGVLDYCASSLFIDRPPILHAKTASLPYYQGKNLGHYIAIERADRSTKTLYVDDCNGGDDRKYFGPHQITAQQAKAALPSGRYLIYA